MGQNPNHQDSGRSTENRSSASREFTPRKDGLENPADRQSSSNLETFKRSDQSSSVRSEKRDGSEKWQPKSDRTSLDRDVE